MFHSGPFIWISVSKCEGTDPITVAESALLAMKGHILTLRSFQHDHTGYLDALLAVKESDSCAVMVYLYLRDMKDYAAVNGVYAKAFTSHYPARLVQFDDYVNLSSRHL